MGFSKIFCGQKTLTLLATGAMAVAARVRCHRRSRRDHPRLPRDDAAERRAIIREYGVFIEELETTLEQLPPGADRGFVLGH
jgi:hypothetical protein